MAKEIILNAFCCNSMGNICSGQWRHPRDTTINYKKMDYWLDFARLLERGLFDALFIADGLGVSDSYRGSAATSIRQGGTGFPKNDPLQVVPAMATVTEHLGFGITCAVPAEQPFPFARRMTTLDHLTDGRAGWNIVTSYHESAARNLGVTKTMGHDERYDQADEYMEVCYKLWEGSWQDDARSTAERGDVFADPSKVHYIDHKGKYYDVPGCFVCEPSPQRTPLLFQAGASKRGSEFGAKHAEIIFTGAPTAQKLRGFVSKMRDAVRHAGRDGYDIKILNVACVIVAETDGAAQDLYNDYLPYADYEAALAQLSGYMGMDLSIFPMDEPISHFESNAMQTIVESFGKDSDRTWTVRELAKHFAFGSAGPMFIGSPATVADAMLEWIETSDTDGFNVSYVVHPENLTAVVDLLVPELQRRGAFKTAYRPGTLREKLFATGAHLPSEHAGAGYRHLHAPVEPNAS